MFFLSTLLLLLLFNYHHHCKHNSKNIIFIIIDIFVIVIAVQSVIVIVIVVAVMCVFVHKIFKKNENANVIAGFEFENNPIWYIFVLTIPVPIIFIPLGKRGRRRKKSTS